MKTYTNLYESICSFENLLSAWRQARRGKRNKGVVAAFEVNLENELVSLRNELLSQTYVPGAYRAFMIFDPQKRMISAAPFRDRVVHHALCNIIGPIFERTFVNESYANRVGKGTHRAVDQYQRWSRRKKYVLKCDIQKFFPSIDHDVLKRAIRRKICCVKTLWLVDSIIDNSNAQEPVLDYYTGDTLFTPIERRKGLPIGNLTSQFWANVYLSALDHFVKERLRCKYYLRYVDDFIVLGDEKQTLHRVRREIGGLLESLRLVLHGRKTRVLPVAEGLDLLGYRVFPDFRLLRKENVRRFRTRMRILQRKYTLGMIPLRDVRNSIHGWLGHARRADTHRVRRAIFQNVVFSKGCTRRSGRVLRGGSWNNNENNCRVANRNRNNPKNRNNNVGFRCAQD